MSQNLNEIIIECSRQQAVVNNGNSTWRTQTQPIILNEGDKIEMIGSLINTQNSGDEAIEVYNQQNRKSKEVDASFKFSYYKTANAMNMVAFPYHSLSIQSCLGKGVDKFIVGYSQETYAKMYGEPMILNPDVAAFGGTDWGGNTYKNSVANSLQMILHKPNSEAYDKSVYNSYSDFLKNLGNTDQATFFDKYPQGNRDVINTGNIYTLCFQNNETTETNPYGFELLEREVQIKLPCGFYSPTELAATISQQMTTIYFNKDVVGDLPETWSNGDRYVKCMTSVAQPNHAITAGNFFGTQDRSNPTDFNIMWNGSTALTQAARGTMGHQTMASCSNGLSTGDVPDTANPPNIYTPLQNQTNQPFYFIDQNPNIYPAGIWSSPAEMYRGYGSDIVADSGFMNQFSGQISRVYRDSGVSNTISTEIDPRLIDVELIASNDEELQQLLYLQFMYYQYSGASSPHQLNAPVPSNANPNMPFYTDNNPCGNYPLFNLVFGVMNQKYANGDSAYVNASVAGEDCYMYGLLNKDTQPAGLWGDGSPPRFEQDAVNKYKFTITNIVLTIAYSWDGNAGNYNFVNIKPELSANMPGGSFPINQNIWLSCGGTLFSNARPDNGNTLGWNGQFGTWYINYCPYNRQYTTQVPTNAPVVMGKNYVKSLAYNDNSSTVSTIAAGGNIWTGTQGGASGGAYDEWLGNFWLYSASTPFSWSAYRHRYSVDNYEGNFNQYSSNTGDLAIDDSDPLLPNSFNDYQSGVHAMGCSVMNHNRWSLYNWEIGDTTTDDKSENLFPFLRKYPLWTKAGTALYTQNNSTIYIQNEVRTGRKMPMMDGVLAGSNWDALNFRNIDQENKMIAEAKPFIWDKLPTSCGCVEVDLLDEDSIYTRTTLWYNFIVSQIDDGLIDMDVGTETYNYFEKINQEFFSAFTHVGITFSNDDDLPAYTGLNQGGGGNDITWRERPRGLITLVHKTSFLNPNVIYDYDTGKIVEYKDIIYDKDKIYFLNGMSLQYKDATPDNWYIGMPTRSWIYDRSMYVEDEAIINFGFMDYNLTIDDGTTNWVIDLTGSIDDLRLSKPDDTTFKIGWGYSYCKNAWRNFTSMLCSYNPTSSGQTQALCNPEVNRMNTSVKNDKWDASDWGGQTFTDRILVGGRSPSLAWDNDRGRFFFEAFYLPQQLANKYYEGQNNEGNAVNLVSTTQNPFQYPNKDNVSGYSRVVDSTGAGEDIAYQNTENDIPLNANAGADVLQYNKEKWELVNNGLYQLVPEQTKHDMFDWGIETQFNGYALGIPPNAYFACEEADSPVGYYYQNAQNWNETLDFTLFCFDADVRYNNWLFGVANFSHSQVADLQTGTRLYPENWDATNKPIQYDSGNYPPFDTALSSDPPYYGDGWSISYYWGACSGDWGYKQYKSPITKLLNTPNSEAASARPDPTIIYGEKCGLQVYNWGKNATRENWDNSFWSVLGFERQDLLPSPYVYCNQTRNFTTNFLSDYVVDFYNNDILKNQSFPIRNNAALTDTGFISVTSSVINGLQYTLQYPRDNYISQVGLEGINKNGYAYASCIGGTIKSIDNPTSKGVRSWKEFIWFRREPSMKEIEYIQGGASFENGQLILNDFTIFKDDETDFGTRIYSNKLPQKIQNPFYIIRASLSDEAVSGSYINNAEYPSLMPVMGTILLQYGITTQYFYSENVSQLTFTNTRSRVITYVDVDITDNYGNAATTLEDKSTIFFKITRATIDPDAPIIRAGEELNRLGDIQVEELEMDKEQRRQYEEEIKDLLNQDEIINF